ncbi:MAG: heavy-metal-associated domain-containing protein [Spirosomataceae bacterium]
MKKIGMILAFIVATTATSFAQRGEVEIKTSAVCGMCKSRIERDLGLTKGVEKATLDLKTKVVTVSYNTKKTNAAQIKSAISQIGYDADEVVANEKSHDRLPECCKKTAKAH